MHAQLCTKFVSAVKDAKSKKHSDLLKYEWIACDNKGKGSATVEAQTTNDSERVVKKAVGLGVGDYAKPKVQTDDDLPYTIVAITNAKVSLQKCARHPDEKVPTTEVPVGTFVEGFRKASKPGELMILSPPRLGSSAVTSTDALLTVFKSLLAADAKHMLSLAEHHAFTSKPTPAVFFTKAMTPKSIKLAPFTALGNIKKSTENTGEQIINVGDIAFKASPPSTGTSADTHEWKDGEAIVPFWWVQPVKSFPNLVAEQITLANGVTCTMLTNPERIPAFKRLTVVLHTAPTKRLQDIYADAKVHKAKKIKG